jgi:hypothetical protein
VEEEEEEEEQLRRAIELSQSPKAPGTDMVDAAAADGVEVEGQYLHRRATGLSLQVLPACGDSSDNQVPSAPVAPSSPSSSGSVPTRTSQRKAALFTFLDKADLEKFGPVLIAEGLTGVDEELIVIGFKNAEIKRLRRFLQSRADVGDGGACAEVNLIQVGSSSNSDSDFKGGDKSYAGGGSSGVSVGVKISSQDAAQCDEGAAPAEEGRSRDAQAEDMTPCRSKQVPRPLANRFVGKEDFSQF